MIALNYPKFWQSKSFVSLALLPFSLIYILCAYLRQFLVRTRKLPCKVICVGNPTVGGTGKTQLVASIARNLSKDNVKFVIISKGYRGNFTSPTIVTSEMSSDFVGDEALELSKFGTTIVSKKVIDAEHILRNVAPDVVIVDDGLQNPSFYKDYKIAIVDASRAFGNGLPIPAGPLRMPQVLQDADVIVSVGAARIVENSICCEIVPLLKLDCQKRYFAFAAIGNPERFFSTLRSNGVNLEGTMAFPDHHKFSGMEISELKVVAKKIDAVLVTTAKDYVKLKPVDRENVICYEVKLAISEEEKFMKDIYEKIFQSH